MLSDVHITWALLAVLIIAVSVVAAEVYRLNDTIAPIAESTIVRTATSF